MILNHTLTFERDASHMMWWKVRVGQNPAWFDAANGFDLRHDILEHVTPPETSVADEGRAIGRQLWLGKYKKKCGEGEWRLGNALLFLASYMYHNPNASKEIAPAPQTKITLMQEYKFRMAMEQGIENGREFPIDGVMKDVPFKKCDMPYLNYMAKHFLRWIEIGYQEAKGIYPRSTQVGHMYDMFLREFDKMEKEKGDRFSLVIDTVKAKYTLDRLPS